MSIACKALIAIGVSAYTFINILTFINDMMYENDYHTSWAPVYYKKLRKRVTPFGAFIPTFFVVCLTLVYQILFILLKGCRMIKRLWLNAFKRKDEEI